jgi:hypothetical protein
MPALEAGATKMEAFAFQKTVEDFSVEIDAQVAQQHDSQGAHTAITADSLAPNVGLEALLVYGLRLMMGPLLMEVDGNPNSPVGVLRVPEITASQHDYNPAGLDTAIMLELTSDDPYTITGIVTSRRRRWLGIVNRSNDTITLAHNSGSSTTAYRIAFSHGGDYELRSGGIVWLYYDPGAPNWRGEGPGVGIRSIQRGTIVFANGDTSKTATLATPLLSDAKCHVAYLGSSGGTSTASSNAYLHDLSTVSISATRTSSADAVTIGYQVTEYY